MESRVGDPPGTHVVRERFAVPIEYPVVFERDCLAPSAEALEWAMSRADLGETPRVFAVCDAGMVEATARRDIDLALRRCTALRQVLLKAAFEGTLVEQRSDDEPADVLLARIRAERETVAPAKTKQRRFRRAETHEASAS